MNWLKDDMIRHPVLGTYVFRGTRCGFLWFNHCTGITELGLEPASIERKLNDPESNWTKVDHPEECQRCGKPWRKHTIKSNKHVCPS